MRNDLMRNDPSEGGFMKKRDDDLKIDISEIFGDGWTPPPSPGETPPASGNSQPMDTPPVPSSPESETAFQAWRVLRDKELESKSQEMEKHLQEINIPPAAINPAAESVPEPTTISESEAGTETISPVDFNAPMAPPFMGMESIVPSVAAPRGPVPEAAAENPSEMDPKRQRNLKNFRGNMNFSCFMMNSEILSHLR